MAKDMVFETRYKEIGRERARLRRIERNRLHRRNVQDRGMECPDCGGRMIWCTCCREWSKICCQDYGSCECS